MEEKVNMLEFWEEQIKKCEIALEKTEDESKRKDIEQLLVDYKEKFEKQKVYEKIRLEKEQVIGSAIRKYEQEARARGEITNTFIKQHLEAKIKAARWALALAMAMTLLFKGFWALWIVFILLYNWEVKRFKKEALEADLKRGK